MHVVTRNTNNIVSFDVKPERFYTDQQNLAWRKWLWTSEEDIYPMKSICRELNARTCRQLPASCILTFSSKLSGYTFK